MDFRQATNLFADPEFDGEPVQIYEPGENDPPLPPKPPEENGGENHGGTMVDPPPAEPARKYMIDDVEVMVVSEWVQYYGKDGKLITEFLKDYTKKAVLKNFSSLNDFLKRWNRGCCSMSFRKKSGKTLIPLT